MSDEPIDLVLARLNRIDDKLDRLIDKVGELTTRVGSMETLFESTSSATASKK